MSSSMVNESSTAQSDATRRHRRRTSRLRRRLREQFPNYRVRRLVFMFFLGVVAIGAGYMLGGYQPSSAPAAE